MSQLEKTLESSHNTALDNHAIVAVTDPQGTSLNNAEVLCSANPFSTNAMEIFSNLFNSGPFMPHGHCYFWTKSLVALHVISDALIILAYYSIPITLVYFVRKRKDLKFNWMFVCFAVFILACGTTHLMEIWNVWHANYWLSGGIKAITALASVPTAILLVKLLPQALALPSTAQLNRVNEALQSEIGERKQAETRLRELNMDLESRVQERTQELARSNEALRISEHRFRQIAESLPQLVWTCEPDGSCDFLSQRWVDYTGIPAAQQLGSGWLNQVHRDDSDRLMKIWDASVATATPLEVEYRIRHHDGGYRWFDTRAVPLRDETGQVVKWFGSNTDVTERKLAEEAAHQSEVRYRALFDTLIEGFCTIEMIFDANCKPVDYRFIEINPAFEKQTGLHNVQGKLMRDLAPDHEAHWFEIYGKIALTGEPLHFENEAKALGRHYDVCAYRIGGPESRKVAILFNDITDRKRAENEVHCLNAELEQRVIARTAELKLANEELESFSYSISHDLRAPVRAIGGFAKILGNSFNDQIPADAQMALDRIRENTTRMGQLIDGLLDFANLSRKSLAKKSIDPTAIARAVVEELRSEMAERLVKIEIAELPECQADRMLLHQVFTNLLSNALKYSRDRAPAIIKVGWRREKGEKVYFVQDNGAGFDMEYSEKLFQVFQRLHSPEEFDGTGVGLAVVHRIVTRHGGRIWAEARVDHGATFYFTLGESNDA